MANKKNFWNDLGDALLTSIIFAIFWVYVLLLLLRPVNNPKILSFLASGRKVIICCWHQRIVCVFSHKKTISPMRPAGIVSTSRDGDRLARLFLKVKVHPIRGSSSHRGREALHELIQEIKDGSCAIHALDGPTGPPGIIKPGIIRLAQKTGVAIFPLYLSANRAWRVGSWDKMLIPKPFSTVTLMWGEPFPVLENLTSEEFERKRQELEDTMRREQDRLDELCGNLFRLL